MPIKKLDSESETWATVVLRSLAIAGKPGKYISIENGPIADNIPKTSMRKNLLLPFMLQISGKIMPVYSHSPRPSRISILDFLQT
jgi:hypothetical protein